MDNHLRTVNGLSGWGCCWAAATARLLVNGNGKDEGIRVRCTGFVCVGCGGGNRSGIHPCGKIIHFKEVRMGFITLIALVYLPKSDHTAIQGVKNLA